jgi:methylated-DNA-protein-cysteine methyltransferase-like protein
LLSENPDPKLPWHRVLRSDGRIAFPPDHAAFAEQAQRLRAEGVVVQDGRVKNQRAAPTLDELIWSPLPRKTKT